MPDFSRLRDWRCWTWWSILTSLGSRWRRTTARILWSSRRSEWRDRTLLRGWWWVLQLLPTPWLSWKRRADFLTRICCRKRHLSHRNFLAFRLQLWDLSDDVRFSSQQTVRWRQHQCWRRFRDDISSLRAVMRGLSSMRQTVCVGQPQKCFLQLCTSRRLAGNWCHCCLSRSSRRTLRLHRHLVGDSRHLLYLHSPPSLWIDTRYLAAPPPTAQVFLWRHG